VRGSIERHAPLERRQLLQACAHAALEHGALRKAHRPQEGGRAVENRAVGAHGQVAQRDAGLPRRAGGLRAQADLRDVRCARRRAVSLRRAASALACTSDLLEYLPVNMHVGVRARDPRHGEKAAR